MLYGTTINALVTKGPSKMDLVTALAYAYDKVRGPFSVVFYMVDEENRLPLDGKADARYPKDRQSGTPVAAKITSFQYEDGTGESVNLSGYLDYHYYASAPEKHYFNVPFEGHYSIKDRRGRFGIVVMAADDK